MAGSITIDDVPFGCLVIAIEIEGQVYCLECARYGEGESLTEDDIAGQCEPGGVMYCAACGEPLVRRAWM